MFITMHDTNRKLKTIAYEDDGDCSVESNVKESSLVHLQSVQSLRTQLTLYQDS